MSIRNCRFRARLAQLRLKSTTGGEAQWPGGGYTYTAWTVNARRNPRRVGKAKGYRYYIFILFSDYTDTVVIIIRTGRTDDDERHIKGHTAVSELCAQRISCRMRAKNHLGSQAGFGHAKVP